MPIAVDEDTKFTANANSDQNPLKIFASTTVFPLAITKSVNKFFGVPIFFLQWSLPTSVVKSESFCLLHIILFTKALFLNVICFCGFRPNESQLFRSVGFLFAVVVIIVASFFSVNLQKGKRMKRPTLNSPISGTFVVR